MCRSGRLLNATKSSAAKTTTSSHHNNNKENTENVSDNWSAAATNGSRHPQGSRVCCSACGASGEIGNSCQCVDACNMNLADNVEASRAAGRLDAMLSAVWKRMVSTIQNWEINLRAFKFIYFIYFDVHFFCFHVWFFENNTYILLILLIINAECVSKLQ